MDEQHQSVETPSETVFRRRLGRGLNALLGGTAENHEPQAAVDAPDPSLISLELIERNPYQARKEFDTESLKELADSVRLHGVLQPLLVRPYLGRYQLIAGERRLTAARQVGNESVPCRVLELNDQQMCAVSLEENLKRKDLNVLEKAHAFRDYLERFQCSVEDLARQLSLDRSTVTNYLRLLELPEDVKSSLAADKISNGHARALLTLPAEQQIDLCQRIQSESMSVRKTEETVRQLQQERGAAAPETIPFRAGAAKAKSRTTNHVLSLQDQLRDALGARVEIKVTKKESGKIVIHFDSNDQFEGILRQLRRAA